MSVQFNDYSMQVKAAIEEKALIFLDEAASELKSQTQRNTPVDTSNLKGSWDYIVNKGKKEATIGSPLENAVWTELGTGEYALEGKGKKGAWYVPVEKATGRKKPSFNGKVVIVHGKNGKSFYKTNGKKPVRMLFNAFTTKKAAIINRAKQIFGELGT